MTLTPLQPEGWERPSGFSNGLAAPAGSRLVFVAGQVAFEAGKRPAGGLGDFVTQFKKALENVVAVVRAAGGGPEHLASMTIFVLDKKAYLKKSRELGPVWSEVMGKHYPAMALVEVKGLVEEEAVVEIQAIAVV